MQSFDIPPHRFQFDNDAKTLYCRFVGSQNGIATTQTIEATNDALEHFPETQQVVFDLLKVDFIVSMFLRLCLQTFRRFGSENFYIIGAHDEVLEIFKISNLDMLLVSTR